MKIGIIGPNGQLGSELMKSFIGHKIIAYDHSTIDVSNPDSCATIKKDRPDVIINTAAYHKTELCELDPEKAYSVNAVGAKNISTVCKEIDAVAIYISTDYVFDGTKNSPYTEKDLPNPINTYGISKLAGEYHTKFADKYYIIRTSGLFGTKGSREKGGNFVETMIAKAKNNEKIKVVNDVVTSVTYSRDAADMIRKIVEAKLPYGIYHVTNSGICTWYVFAKTIFNILHLDADLTPVNSSECMFKAKRPQYSALKNGNLRKSGMHMQDWKLGLNDYLTEKEYL